MVEGKMQQASPSTWVQKENLSASPYYKFARTWHRILQKSFFQGRETSGKQDGLVKARPR